jgi:hemolysin activation/secretion protein
MAKSLYFNKLLYQCCFAFTCWSSLLVAQDNVDEICSLTPSFEEDQLLAPVLQGLVLQGNENHLDKHGLEKISGFHVFDIMDPDEIEELRDKMELHYLNQPFRKTTLVQLKQEITDYFENKAKRSQVVLVPGQDISDGFLHLVVMDRLENEVAVADEAFPKLPLPPTDPPKPPEDHVLIPCLQGIVLIGHPEDIKTDGIKHLDDVFVVDVFIPGGAASLRQCIGPKFLGQCLTQKRLVELKRCIIDYFRMHRKPIVAIQIPEQDITGGVLQLLVVEGKLGEIRSVGNCWTPSCRLENYMSLCPGDPIDEARVIQDLSFMNRNPFRRTDVVYTPGTHPGTTDIELVTEDRRPIRVYIGAENTGVETTDRERILAGFNWGNVFGLDHVFSYQFTASPDFHKFKAHTVHYTAPLPWRHLLNVFGGVSFVHPKIPKCKRSDGYGVQGSLRYDIPLRPTQEYLHEFSWGFDFKRSNNNIEFVETPIFFGSYVNLTQLVVGYNAAWDRNGTKTTLDGEIFWSPGKWLNDQSDRAYQTLRAFAKNQYIYGKLELSHIIRVFRDFSLSLIGKGQLSNRNLLPSEEFGLGGHDSVRGYDEREENADNALLLSSELRSPVMHLFRCKNHCLKDELQLLWFIDYGLGGSHRRIKDEPAFHYLLGAGPGVRYMIAPCLSARLDWGIKLHHSKSLGRNNSRVHFALVASF